MIKSWQHKGLKNFYETGSKAGIQPKHAEILAILLLQLASAVKAEDMDTPGNSFHSLVGDLKGYYSVKVSGNWRIIFKFIGEDAILVDYIDYH
jgi:toxin HigB-1